MLRTSLITLTAVGSLAFGLMAGEAEAGGGGHGCDAPVSDAESSTVAMDGTCFAPTIVRVGAGDTVTWENSGTPHTVTAVDSAWGDNETIAIGESVTHRFAESGVYPYFCALHPGMIGTVVVGDGSPSLVTAGGGRLAVEEVERSGPAQAVEASGGNDDSNVWVAAGVVAVVAIVAAGVAYTTGWRLATRR